MSTSSVAGCKYCGRPCREGSEVNICDECSQRIKSLKHRNASEPDFRRNRRLGYIAYIPFCFIIVMLMSGESSFGRHHAKRGMYFTIVTILFAAICVSLFMIFGNALTLPYIVSSIAITLWILIFVFFTAFSPNMK